MSHTPGADYDARMRPTALTTSLVLALAAAACGPGERTVEPVVSPEAIASADSTVRAWVDEGRVPGAVLRVAYGDRVLIDEAYGYAQLADYGRGQYPPEFFDVADPATLLEPLADPVLMTVGTVFDLASVTKVMATTMAVMILVDRGALDIDAPVSDWLPDFTGGGKESITIRHLLTHRSGLEQWKPTYYHASNASEAYAYIRDLPLGWRPGEERHYSDFGFMLLGRVVEEAAGMPLDRFLAGELYEPLGLAHTGFRPAERIDGPGGDTGPLFAATSHGNPFERRMVHDGNFGYRIDDDPDSWDGWRRYTLLAEVNDGNAHHAFGDVAGHAGLFSSAAELSTLLRLLLDGGEAAGRRFFSEDVVQHFLADTGDDQALGWQLPAYAPDGAFGHTGFTGTFVMGVPAIDLSIVLLTNRQNGGVDRANQYPDVGPLQRAVVAALTR